MIDIKNIFYTSTAESLILFSIDNHYNLKKYKKKHALFMVLKQITNRSFYALTAGLWGTNCQEMLWICQEALSWIL